VRAPVPPKSVDFTLYRGRQRGNSSSVLVLAPTAEYPSPESLRRYWSWERRARVKSWLPAPFIISAAVPDAHL